MNTNPQTERETYQLIPFTFENQLVNMVFIDAEPWFIAQGIGKILGYKGASINGTLYTFPENEIRAVRALACGQKRKFLALSVSALSRLLFITKKPVAEKLNLWLLTKVLLSVSQIKMSHQIERLEEENCILRQFIAKDKAAMSKGRHLTEAEKNIIRDLRRVDNLSFEEIGRVIGRSSEAVRQVLKEVEL
jgi:prophage antirepressor-like protein